MSTTNLKNSTKYIGLCCLCLFHLYNLIGQSTIRVNKIPELSQNTNLYLLNTPDNQLFISSIEGLNVFDGLHEHTYKPGAANMYGQNIQSNFFKDRTGKIWFTTYEALHCFDQNKNAVNYFFMKDVDGQELKENYVAFKLVEDLLYLKAGNKFFVYNTSTGSFNQPYQISLEDYFHFEVMERNDNQFLFAGGPDEYCLYELKEANNFELLERVSVGISSCLGQDQTIWIGGSNGLLYQYDLDYKKVVNESRIGDLQISGILPFTDSTLLLADYRGLLSTFSIRHNHIDETFELRPFEDCEPIKALMRPYIDQDSTLWVGSNGQGVYYYNLNKRKFNTWLEGYDITKLIEYKKDQLIVLTRREGILLMDLNGQVIHQWLRLPNQKDVFSVKTGVLVDSDKLLFTANKHAYALDLHKNLIHPLVVSGYKEKIYFNQLDRLTNGRILAALDTTFLYEVTVYNQTLYLKPYFIEPPGAKMMLSFKQDNQANLYISNEESNILVFKADDVTKGHVYETTISLTGGVLSIADALDSEEIYLTNAQGIFRINKKTKTYTQVMDKDSILYQTVYSCLPDANNNLWLATNSGLIRFDPLSNNPHVFSTMDGIQDREFNSGVSMVTEDGHMYFGGINGLNYFHPDEVRLSQRPAPIYISDVKINDKPDSRFRIPQYVSSYNLPFTQNTISFKFHAVDNADPDAAYVKYILVGADPDTLFSDGPEADNVRYLNLSPGDYVLSIIGVNSDGVQNKESRDIFISIRPPYWMTWWFRTLAGMAVIGLIYWITRGYYQRKLERKNQQLREQNLIIDKQQAVEQERTRIASEMHDDIGSGLTTIRYLSDRALRQAKDEEEISQIKTIADKSNDLVRNMSEIIWAMNSRFDNTENLIAYLRRYASEYLDQYQINVEFITPGEEAGVKNIGGEKRRNVFLVFKELLHNTVKYSKAYSVKIKMDWDNAFSINISEIGGIGFDPVLAMEKGNGLFNCRRRMEAIGGRIVFERKPDAMEIKIQAPL